jgi:hypothetical protein
MALRVSGALKPHHHDKVETPAVGSLTVWVDEKTEECVWKCSGETSWKMPTSKNEKKMDGLKY